MELHHLSQHIHTSLAIMALMHFLHVACNIVLGNQNDTSKMQKNDRATLEESHKKIIHRLKNESGFQMPLHYPRYKKCDYERMEEWKVDILLMQYGLRFDGTLEEKRAYAIGTFLWPDQL